MSQQRSVLGWFRCKRYILLTFRRAVDVSHVSVTLDSPHHLEVHGFTADFQRIQRLERFGIERVSDCGSNSGSSSAETKDAAL